MTWDPSPDQPEDAGEPIAELGRLRVESSGMFVERVHAGLDRRDLAANLLEFWLRAFVEFLGAIAPLVLRPSNDPRDRLGVRDR